MGLPVHLLDTVSIDGRKCNMQPRSDVFRRSPGHVLSGHSSGPRRNLSPMTIKSSLAV